MKCGIKIDANVNGLRKWLLEASHNRSGSVKLWETKAEAKKWIRAHQSYRFLNPRVAPFIVHPAKPPRMGTDRFWGWFGGIVGKQCTHPDHRVGETCVARAAACSPDCDCCLGK